ncbi:NAD(P)H-dependent oxidoreductase [Desulfobaculum bizertense]|uniref:FMN-dependent NADH-azoreductase n=1 Tax=Desulfobaculum bizertense TaxID=376490 RepID=UPI001F38B502|nr:NAD(P)H-dependent oxidoreductase [Desulfobaculum bizertense]UIJ39370.1 NAD(P)H-dependent oxidoreductase [Desulfobaculum bizertense]
MDCLLYVKASPRGERSHSLSVADEFVKIWLAAHPGGLVTEKNLFEVGLPSFDGFRIQAKYNIMHGLEHTMSEKNAWKEVEELIGEFKAHKRYLFAVPMWNFGVPYILKQYIDIINQPGYTFGVAEDGGYHGLVQGRKAMVVYSRGGEYIPGTPAEGYNHQSPYLEMMLNFMGITDVESVAVEGTMMGPDKRDENKEQALEAARQIATHF